jgi:RNA polymerase sigma-70 factor (ECF subfamily)
MAKPDSTCWSVIRGAAAGDATDRAQFAQRYVGLVRHYLGARWRGSPYQQDVDDAVQEVFLACFRPEGVLDRAAPEHPGGFRAYLYGVVRNVARRVEEARAKAQAHLAPLNSEMSALPADEATLSRVFDRAWAQTLLREAAQRQAEIAAGKGPEAQRRVELLQLRFHGGLPVREIARLWQTDPGKVHHEYARARREFREALREVVAFHQPGPPEAIEQACVELFTLLG